MQLFITTYSKKEQVITIGNADILSQVRKVLRAKIGDTLWIQDPVNEADKIRYEVRIDDWNDKELYGTILSETHHHVDPGKITMIVAMTNKWDKAELIMQKLSEIGINEIIFRPAERSVIKEWNSKKEERMQKIIKEAVEQSRGRTMPELHFTTDITKYIENAEVIVFDKTATGNLESRSFVRDRPGTWDLGPVTGNLGPGTLEKVVGIIGPEGGLTAKDYQQCEAYKPKIMSLGATVLRMETAAIVGARLLKNN